MLTACTPTDPSTPHLNTNFPKIHIHSTHNYTVPSNLFTRSCNHLSDTPCHLPSHGSTTLFILAASATTRNASKKLCVPYMTDHGSKDLADTTGDSWLDLNVRKKTKCLVCDIMSRTHRYKDGSTKRSSLKMFEA